jgi:hypothetical protein
MSWTNLSVTAALTTAVLVLLPVGSAAPGVLTGGAQEGAGCTTPADGSCNLVFRDEHDLVGLDPEELNQTVFEGCPGFPDGPYRREDLDGDPPIDYVTKELGDLEENTSLTLFENDVLTQIGADVDLGVLGLELTINGEYERDTAEVTIVQNDVGAELAPVSQILDLGGPDWFLFEKSQGGGGGQRATLVCEFNMWFDDGVQKYGLKEFFVNHSVQRITAGWIAGPSGFSTRLKAVEACDRAGTAFDKVGGEVGDPTPSFLVASYKSTTENPVPIINVTGCGVTAEDDPVLTAYCDAGEVSGSPDFPRPNACNPEGGQGGLPDVTTSGVNGLASTCWWFFRGTPIFYNC